MKKQWLPGCSASVHMSSPMMAARASTSWLCSSFITLDDGQTLTHGDETLTHATRRSRTATETARAPRMDASVSGRVSQGAPRKSLRTRAYRRSFGLRGDQWPEGFSFVGYFQLFVRWEFFLLFFFFFFPPPHSLVVRWKCLPHKGRPRRASLSAARSRPRSLCTAVDPAVDSPAERQPQPYGRAQFHDRRPAQRERRPL